ncbi:thioredoxin family protein [Sediminibacillus halophilus]|uniref:Thioredoxin n=1 Tax=Sediminibacillus halophilus TaxID=482461 RepID=A0A1G9QZ14_9BACI|nr:thioredoxin family protein [Sediminibacillus halophilus]SDM16111.1 Thioredoxin [Sediminibacillus halophilus]
MLPISDERTLKDFSKAFVFIHTPFCGTCKMAEKMLLILEQIEEDLLFHEMNASLFPGFMQSYQVESVPCLLIVENGRVQEKVYAFQSLMHIQEKLQKYRSKKE